MNKRAKIVIGLIVFLTVTGCAATRKYEFGSINLTTENIHKIERGKTTQAEILGMFGEPMSKTQSGALGTFWIYTRSTSRTTYDGNFFSMGPEHEARSFSISIIFDDDGIVKDYSYSEINPVQEGTVTYSNK